MTVAQAFGQPQGEAGGGVHGHGDTDQVQVVERGGPRIGLDGEVQRANVVAGGAQGPSGRGEAEGLVALLVGGDQKDSGHGYLAAAPSFCGW